MPDGRAKNGGKREGAGRPIGATGTAPYGQKKSLKVAGLRVPEGATPEQRALADWAQARIIRVAAGKVDPSMAHSILKAASTIREEICGPVTQKHQVEGGLLIQVVDPYAEPKK